MIAPGLAIALLLATGQQDQLKIHVDYSENDGTAVSCGAWIDLFGGGAVLSGAGAIAGGMKALQSLDSIMAHAMSGEAQSLPETTGEIATQYMSTPAAGYAASLPPTTTAYYATVDATLTYDPGRRAYVVDSGGLTWKAWADGKLHAKDHLLYENLSGGGSYPLKRGDIVVRFDGGSAQGAMDPRKPSKESTYQVTLSISHPATLAGNSGWIVNGIASMQQVYGKSSTDFDWVTLGQKAPIPSQPPCTVSKGIGYQASDREVKDHQAAFAEHWLAPTGSTITVFYEITYPMEAEIDPVPAGWLPEGKDDGSPGNDVKLKMRMKEPKGLAADWEVTVDSVTGYPGTAADSTDTGTEADFEIQQAKNPDLDLSGDLRSDTMTVKTKKPVSELSLTLTSMDWAAWARVRAKAIVNGQEYAASVTGQPGTNHLTVPKDDDENGIGDAWPGKKGPDGESRDPGADDDGKPDGDGINGDGFTVLEEYRGFYVLDGGALTHARTDPGTKDLFVRNDAGDAALAGVSLFGSASKIRTRVVDDSHVQKDMIINRNAVDGSQPQHGILVQIGPVSGGNNVAGEMIPRNHGRNYLPLSPGEVESVNINGGAVNDTDPAATIAHEIAHGLHVDHHGAGDFQTTVSLSCVTPDPSCSNGRCPVQVAVPQGQESGALACIMRYDVADLYEACMLGAGGAGRAPDGSLPQSCWNAGAQAVLQLLPKSQHVKRNIFCSSPVGTGVLGNATLGDCAHQFHVTDHPQANPRPGPVPGGFPPPCK